MTQSREAKATIQKHMTGTETRNSAYNGQPMTVQAFKRDFLGRRGQSTETAQIKKADRTRYPRTTTRKG